MAARKKSVDNEEFKVDIEATADPSTTLADIGIDAPDNTRRGSQTEDVEKIASGGGNERRSRKKVRIMIDEVPGMSNYEVIGCNGDVIQVKRGVPVWVDQKYVNVLQDAVTTTTEIVKNPVTGEREERIRQYSAVPWRRV